MTFKQFLITAVFCIGLLAVSVSADDIEILSTEFVFGIEIQYTEETDIETAFDPEYSMESVVLAGDADAPTYHSDYGYISFAAEEDGDAKQTLYRRIDAAAILFHNDYTMDAADNNIVTRLNYADIGLSSTEALEVWNIYKHDHPLYYWIANTILYNPTSLYLRTDDLYDEGTEREQYNALIHEKIPEYPALTEGETSSYRIAMAYHDAIIDAIDYAYKPNGDPETALWAHNILGVFTKEGGVCESYARTFQLLLNLSGVENIFVTGSARDGHAWNLVRMDDGEWYWCDLTWDDCPDWMWGVKHNYFCVNDTENLNWSDGGESTTEEVDFLDQHTADTPSASSLYYLYPLPERAAEPYTSVNGELLLRDVFTNGQFTCAVAGYNAVQVVEVNCTETDLVIPETVGHNGTVYNIISIGGMNENGRFTGSGLSWSGEKPETVTISKTLKFIWDLAFSSDFLSGVHTYSVSEDNPYFTSDNGVLFTKSKYTLIQYPSAHTAIEYETPAETQEIAFKSFALCTYLEKLTLGAGVETVGSTNCGNGYRNNHSAGSSGTVSGEFNRFYQALTGKKIIEIHKDNTNYTEIDGVIYAVHDDGTLSLMFASKSIEKVKIPDNTICIVDYAFMNCVNLKEITIPNPKNIFVKFGNYAFYLCQKLEDVYFMGDIPETWGTDVFSQTSPELTLHYLAGNKSGWTAPTWTAPDGVTYNTKPFDEEAPVVPGDADRDGRITESDALLLKQYFSGYEISIDVKTADIDKDGQVTRSDAMYLARALAGWDGYDLP